MTRGRAGRAPGGRRCGAVPPGRRADRAGRRRPPRRAGRGHDRPAARRRPRHARARRRTVARPHRRPGARTSPTGAAGATSPRSRTDAQVAAKVDLVTDSLRRLGRWQEPVVHAGPALDPWGFRTTLRLAVTNGRAGLRRAGEQRRGRARPLPGRAPAARRAHRRRPVPRRQLRDAAGRRRDRRAPRARRAHARRRVAARRRARGRRRRARRGRVHPTHRSTTTSPDGAGASRPARSSRPATDGAAALVDVVRTMAADVLDRETGVLLDAYSGVGLFAGALLDGRPRMARAVTVENDSSSVADARVNLADLDVRIVETTVESCAHHAPISSSPIRHAPASAPTRPAWSRRHAPSASCSSAAIPRPRAATSVCSSRAATDRSSRSSSTCSRTPTTPKW